MEFLVSGWMCGVGSSDFTGWIPGIAGVGWWSVPFDWDIRGYTWIYACYCMDLLGYFMYFQLDSGWLVEVYSMFEMDLKLNPPICDVCWWILMIPNLEWRSFLSSWSFAAKIEMMGITKRSMAMVTLVTDNQRSSTLNCSKSISLCLIFTTHMFDD